VAVLVTRPSPDNEATADALRAKGFDVLLAPMLRFEAVPGAYGAFPSAHRARVIWVGLERGGEALVALARALDRALERRGFDRPDRAFTAHLTLGRVREREADWSAALAAAPKRDPVGLEFRVERLSVVESTLSPRGSIYRVRLEAPLTS